MIQDDRTTREFEEWEMPESYPTFWEAIPVDAVHKPGTLRDDGIAASSNHAADGRVLLMVEQSDVGIG